MSDEACGGMHVDVSQLYITRLNGSNEKCGICPCCGEYFDKDDFPEIENMVVADRDD